VTRPSILIVEDDASLRRGLVHYLSKLYTIRTAGSVVEALACLEEGAPDLVLLDFQLPDATGDHVIEAMRRRRSSVPIILMSASFTAESAENLVFGASDFISKPFRRDMLLTKIERQLTARSEASEAARQRATIEALHARRDEEAAIARSVLDRMLLRGDFDLLRIRYTVRSADRFPGDAVFGAKVGDRYRWMVADVTGHTLASALVTIPVSMLFYSDATFAVPLERAVAHMDGELAKLLPVGMFCAAAICELDPATGTLVVWNGGMPDVLVRSTSGCVVRVPSNDTPLAADRRRVGTPELAKIEVHPGTRIYTLSDGVVEARDGKDQPLGIDVIAKLVQAAAIETIYDTVLTRWTEHIGTNPPEDDMSFVEVVA
jgi:two-component system, HptB-dependent secretion and biofilm response regulator